MSTSVDIKRTALHSEHVRLGAKMIDFGGWDMPVQYSGIIAEHNAVRTQLGVFDISHMGQVFVSGDNAEAWLNGLLANNVTKLAVSEGHYSFLLNERGGVIDDLLVYRVAPKRWLLVINASKVDEDLAWMQHHKKDGVDLQPRTQTHAGVAVQGPKAGEWAAAFLGKDAAIPGRNHIAKFEVDGTSVWVARTGYTGEDGFEVFFSNETAVRIFRKILETGAAFGILPCGLGSRDTLRLEMCYPLNGNDLSPERTPLAAGLGFFVDLSKAFIGSDVLVKQKADGVSEKLVAFKMVGKAPPARGHYEVWKDGEKIGETCSGGLSPSLGTGIGMAYLPTALATVGAEIEVDIRGKRYPAIIEKKPLYKNGSAQ